MIAAAATAAISRTPEVFAEETAKETPAETIQHAVLGCRIRGRVHAGTFARKPNVSVAYVCDPDRALAEELADAVEKQQGRRPKAVQDLRVVLDDPAVNTVSIATPNHWHALGAVWAMQAGKDVYVEKPVSNTIVEGRRMVQVARSTGRICQAGTQNRSSGVAKATAAYLHAGKLGDLKLGRTIVYGRRGSIGPRAPQPVPEGVDFNLWLGPAAKPLERKNLHYDWHWIWDTGNGELGNNNIHYVDLVRWMMKLDGLGDSVISIGGRLGYEDAGETPNTQMVVHTFGPVSVIQEVRGLKTTPFSEKFKAGWIIEGTEGFVAGGSLFDRDGNLVQTFEGPGEDHFANFLKAVRSRRMEDLNADILQGHLSTGLCHVGNISHRLGRLTGVEEMQARLGDSLTPEAGVTLKKMTEHLEENGVDLKSTPLTVGARLQIDSKAETFVANPAANRLLSRDYRGKFVLPDAS
ncbi:Alpha-N-acetylgalactosaminidase [Caulifigura coniformis]|uniref:Alpha-N-acetylgalactosaminidase n=2 Tax=Caulifigura coniformis TaxID=2527983 RepID=A0A517S911_9PLAN|nr:Alpha-N-acetylgalactosaminidase [Caulifigura coniformis]